MADPRLQDRPRTVNEQLADAIIVRSARIERVKSKLAREHSAMALRELDKIAEAVERYLRRIANRGHGALAQKNFDELMERVGTVSKAAYDALAAALMTDVLEIAALEAGWIYGEIKDHIPGLAVSLTSLTKRTAESIARKRPFQGRGLRKWMRDLDTDTQRRVREAIRQGVIEGESYRQITRRLRGTRSAGFADGILPRSVQHIDTTVRTAVQHTVSAVREETYKENSDLVREVQWVATLDLVTCPICASLDGNTWEVGKGQRPPAHPNCRCVHTPVLKSFRELGLSGDMAPGMRASMSGEVPANLNFGQWLKTRSPREQDAVLGRTRGAAFRAGKFESKGKPIDPAKILGANRRPLPVSALRRKGLV